MKRGISLRASFCRGGTLVSMLMFHIKKINRDNGKTLKWNTNSNR